MPQLPSGRHVALTADPILELARQGNWGLTMAFTLEVKSVEDLAPLLNIAYFKPVAGESGPGVPYPSGLMLSDIGTEKCDWPTEDVAFFNTWLASDAVRQWMQNTHDELAELIRTVKAPLPDNLRGILDHED